MMQPTNNPIQTVVDQAANVVHARWTVLNDQAGDYVPFRCVYTPFDVSRMISDLPNGIDIAKQMNWIDT